MLEEIVRAINLLETWKTEDDPILILRAIDLLKKVENDGYLKLKAEITNQVKMLSDVDEKFSVIAKENVNMIAKDFGISERTVRNWNNGIGKKWTAEEKFRIIEKYGK